MTKTSVLNLLHDDLWDIPKKAKQLPWADRDCWTFKTHLWIDDNVLFVDLHDLSVPLARQVVQKSLKAKIAKHVAAVCLITGQGKNSADGPKILPVAMDIAQTQANKRGWKVHTQPGRVYVVCDPEHAPVAVTNQLSRTMVWGIYAFFAMLFGIVLMKLFTA